MLYKYNERLGCDISALGAGTWSMGGTNEYGRGYGDVEDATSIKALHALIDGGVNLIDTAPVYGQYGASEKVVGAALAQDGYRDRVILATKFGNSADPETGARIIDDSRDRILRDCDESLIRLGTDHIDLYIMHWPDPNVPIEETMGALNELKQAGKIVRVGVSNVTREQIEAIAACGDIDAVQLPYSMVNRDTEPLLRWCAEQGYLTMSYGSMGAGILSGAYRELPQFDPKDVRYSFYPYFKEPMFSQIQLLLHDMDVLAERYGCPLAHVALSWTAHKSFIGTSLVGVANVEQAEENCSAFSLELTDEDMAFLDESIACHLGDGEAK